MNAPSRPAWTSRSIRPRTLVVGSALVLAALLIASAGTLPAGSSPQGEASAPARATPGAAFVPNVGQSDRSVRFEARAAGGTLFLTQREIVLMRPTGAVRLRYVGANQYPAVSGVDRLRGVVNYFVGADPSRWHAGLPRYGGVVYRGLYAGVDVRYELQSTSATPWVKATYAVAARADPGRIRWRYAGVRGVSLDPASGALRITPDGEALPALVEAAPAAWQWIGGRRVPVEVRYRIGFDRTIGLVLGRYDRSRPLVVAPTRARQLQVAAAVVYSTYLGGFTWDEAFDVKADSAGNAYVAGFTFSPDFPTANARQAAFSGVIDAFVAKLSPDGHTLLFSTYLGGTKTEIAQGIALDGAGNAYVTGRTESENFPIAGAAQSALDRGNRECQRARKQGPAEHCHDAFVTKLSPTGALVYSTYFGGTLTDEALGIAVDSAGSAYITGNTESLDLATPGTADPTFMNAAAPGASPNCDGHAPCPSDAFVAKIGPTGGTVVYSTYLGGSKSERATGIAVDSGGNAYVTGTTRSPDFPAANTLNLGVSSCAPPPVTPVPCPDAYVTKVNATGSAFAYSRFLGGSKPDAGGGIAVDASANAYVTGSTRSADFPTANAFQAAADNSACSPAGVGPELCDDVFVTKLNAAGTGLVYSTYLAGRADDQGLAITVDKLGSAAVTGSTSSRNFPQVRPTQPAFGGYIDAFVTQLAPSGAALDFSTFLGGNKTERGSGIAFGGPGGNDLFATGMTNSADFPTTVGVVQPGLRGDIDAFVTRFK